MSIAPSQPIPPYSTPFPAPTPFTWFDIATEAKDKKVCFYNFTNPSKPQIALTKYWIHNITKHPTSIKTTIINEMGEKTLLKNLNSIGFTESEFNNKLDASSARVLFRRKQSLTKFINELGCPNIENTPSFFYTDLLVKLIEETLKQKCPIESSTTLSETEEHSKRSERVPSLNEEANAPKAFAQQPILAILATVPMPSARSDSCSSSQFFTPSIITQPPTTPIGTFDSSSLDTTPVIKKPSYIPSENRKRPNLKRNQHVPYLNKGGKVRKAFDQQPLLATVVEFPSSTSSSSSSQPFTPLNAMQPPNTPIGTLDLKRLDTPSLIEESLSFPGTEPNPFSPS